MWKMHDFLGFGECSGLQTSGYFACPICGPRLYAHRSQSLNKMVYAGHQAYLLEDHALREGFLGCKPPHMTASAWKELKLQYHKGLPNGMKRFSIFFELPYWTKLQFNHLLDPMQTSRMLAVSCGIISLAKKTLSMLEKLYRKWELWRSVGHRRV